VGRLVTPRSYEGPERRENGNGFLSGIPVWAKVASVIGIPGAIAFYLVWLGGQTLPNILTEVIAMKADIGRNQIMLGEHVQQINEQNRLLQRICSRVSTTDAERQQCFDR
jgi:hypothetical protein